MKPAPTGNTPDDTTKLSHAPIKKRLGKSRKAVAYRKRKIISEIIEGKTLQAAGESAGYSKESAASQACQMVQESKKDGTFTRILEAAGLTDEYLAARIKQLAEAKETKFFQKDGFVIETREVAALGIQADMIQFGTKLRGHLVDKVSVDFDPLSAALAEDEKK